MESKENQLKIALCLSGQMRTFKECYPSLKKFILEPLKPDVFIYTASNSGVTPKIKDEASFNDERVNKEELKKIYTPRLIEIRDFPKRCREELKGIKVPEILKKKEPRDYKGALLMSYKMHKCNELKKNWEKKNDFTYDAVIHLRPDIKFLEEIPKEVLNHTEIVWHNNSEGGKPCAPWQVSDKFIVSDSKNMDYVASLFKKLPEYWKNPLGENKKRGQHRVGERLMAYHLKNGNFKLKEFFSKCYILRPQEYSKLKKKRSFWKYMRAKTKKTMNNSKLGKKFIDYYYKKIMGV